MESHGYDKLELVSRCTIQHTEQRADLDNNVSIPTSDMLVSSAVLLHMRTGSEDCYQDLYKSEDHINFNGLRQLATECQVRILRAQGVTGEPHFFDHIVSTAQCGSQRYYVSTRRVVQMKRTHDINPIDEHGWLFDRQRKSKVQSRF